MVVLIAFVAFIAFIAFVALIALVMLDARRFTLSQSRLRFEVGGSGFEVQG